MKQAEERNRTLVLGAEKFTMGSEPPFAAPRTGFNVEGLLLLEFKPSFAPAAKGRFPPLVSIAALQYGNEPPTLTSS